MAKSKESNQNYSYGLARAEWLKPYRKVLMFPATSISIEVTGREQPMCKQIAEAIDIMVTFMLCNKIHGNNKKAMQACARELMKRVKDRHNYYFLQEVSKAWLPDAQLRQKVRQMKEAEAKAQFAMKRAGDWPAWMDEE